MQEPKRSGAKSRSSKGVQLGCPFRPVQTPCTNPPRENYLLLDNAKILSHDFFHFPEEPVIMQVPLPRRTGHHARTGSQKNRSSLNHSATSASSGRVVRTATELLEKMEKFVPAPVSVRHKGNPPNDGRSTACRGTRPLFGGFPV